jgi:hypothetical protein
MKQGKSELRNRSENPTIPTRILSFAPGTAEKLRALKSTPLLPTAMAAMPAEIF